MFPCVTHTLRMAKPCTVYGEHLPDCRGVALDGERAVACEGCLPQPATRGMLCESCHERYAAALDVAVDLITHMRSVERGAAPDGPRSPTRPGSQVIVPTSWLTADDTWAALHELAFRCDTSDRLADRTGGTTAYGFGSRDTIEHVRGRVELALDIADTGDTNDLHVAQLAVRFYRAVQTAMAAFPLEEHSRPLGYIACPEHRGGCGHMTLERRPPLQYLDPLVYRCVNPACGSAWDPYIVEVDLAQYRQQIQAEQAA